VDRNRFSSGLIPFEIPVKRTIPLSTNPIGAVLDEYFKGPTESEKQLGLAVILNGFTGYGRVVGNGDIVSVYLTGTCQFTNDAYGIAQALVANLKQFLGVLFVKIYDQNGQTRNPTGRSDSAPACLGSSSLFLPTLTPTSTPRK